MTNIPSNTLVDPFSGSSLDPAIWNFGTSTESGGAAHIADNEFIESPFDAQSNPSATWIDLLNNVLAIEVSAAVASGAGTVYFIIFSADPGSNAAVSIGTDASGNLLGQVASEDGLTLDSHSIPYDAVAQRWWRAREASGTAYAEYSADGITWHTLASAAGTAGLVDGWLQIGKSGTGAFTVEGVNTLGGTVGKSLTTPYTIFTLDNNYHPPANATSFEIARLPFLDAQARFAEGTVVPGTDVTGKVGWHGTKTDIERGSFVLAPPTGRLAYLLGEWLKISVHEGIRPRTVYAYCHSLADLPTDWDLSLTRRLFLSLDLLTTDSVDVDIQVIA